MREVIVRPRGLVTSPNKYGQYPAGAMSTCRNVALRDPGVILSMPARRSFQDNIMSNGYAIRRLFSGDASVLSFGNNAGAWQARWSTIASNTSIAITPPGMSAATIDTAKSHLARARARFFFTSLNDGVMALDAEGGATARAAGMPAPQINLSTSSTTNATCLADGYVARWKATITRLSSDGYELTSEPSTAVEFQNVGFISAVDVTWNITFPLGWDVQAGDILRLWRTKAVPSGSDAGGTYYSSLAVTVTGGMAAAFTTTIKDTLPDAALGEELYTNPGRPVPAIVGVGGAYVNTPPALATDTWTFKTQTFYAMQRLASHKKLRIAGTWGALTTESTRASGIGSRTVSGDSTIGSPTITNCTSTTGIYAGQIVYVVAPNGLNPDPGLINAIVVSKTANTITFDRNATASSTSSPGFVIGMADRIEINGTKITILSFNALIEASTSLVIQATSPAIYSSSAPNVNITMDLRMARYGLGALTLRATNPQNYDPPLTDFAGAVTNGDYDERFNRIQWGKPQQPEAVPPQQEEIYGTGVHYRAMPTRDCTWLFASDGLHRMSGLEDNYRVDPVDSRLILAGRNAVSVCNDTVYAYTNRGLVSIDSGGNIKDIARLVLADLLPGAAYADTWDTFVACDELHREVWLSFHDSASFSTTSYVYSEITETFHDVVDGEWTALEWAPYQRSLVVGMFDGLNAPDLSYFQTDTSTTRMSGAIFEWQPILGDNNPFTQKQWIQWEPIFEKITSISAAVLYTGTLDKTMVLATSSSPVLEARGTIGVPRAAAIGNTFRPRLEFGTGSTTQLWSFRGISTRYVVLSEELGVRR
jgi:hypothetical protein